MYGNFLGQGQHWLSDRVGRLNKFNCMFVFVVFFVMVSFSDFSIALLLELAEEVD